MFGINPFAISERVLNYSGDARRLVAEKDRGIFHPPQFPLKLYKDYHLLGLARRLKGWDDGYFAMDWDKFIKEKSDQRRLQTDEIPSYKIAFAGCFEAPPHIQTGDPLPQARIANALMRNYGSESLDATFLLGDLIASGGAHSPNDARLDAFAQLFRSSGPCMVLAGKRDYDLDDGKWFDVRPRWMVHSKLYRVMSLVMYSYRTISGRNNNWHMPFRYYVWTSEQIRTHFIILDSSTFPYDESQQSWLVTLYYELKAVYSGFRFILIMHHSFRSYGNRDREVEYDHKYAQESYMTRADSDPTSAVNKIQQQNLNSQQLYPMESSESAKLYRWPVLHRWQPPDVTSAGPQEPNILGHTPTRYGDTLPTRSDLKSERNFGTHTIGGLVQRFFEINGLVIEAAVTAGERGLAALEVDMVYCAGGDRKITYVRKITQYISGGGGAELTQFPSTNLALASFTTIELMNLKLKICTPVKVQSSALCRKINATSLDNDDYRSLEFSHAESYALLDILNRIDLPDDEKANLINKLQAQLPYGLGDWIRTTHGYMIMQLSPNGYSVTFHNSDGSQISDSGINQPQYREHCEKNYGTADSRAVKLTEDYQAGRRSDNYTADLNVFTGR